MLKTFVTHETLADYEPSLNDYLRSDQVSYDKIIEKSKEILTQDLKSQGLELKKLCTPLSLHAQGSESTSKTGSKSDEDIAERRILFLNVSAISGNALFTLYGTNDNTDETYTSVLVKAVAEIGEYNFFFDNTFDYYRLDYSGTTCNYKGELVEESFHLAHLYLSLHRVYESMRTQIDQLWDVKSEMYLGLYRNQLNNIRHTYDLNLSGDITYGEEREQIRTTFHR